MLPCSALCFPYKSIKGPQKSCRILQHQNTCVHCVLACVLWSSPAIEIPVTSDRRLTRKGGGMSRLAVRRDWVGFARNGKPPARFRASCLLTFCPPWSTATSSLFDRPVVRIPRLLPVPRGPRPRVQIVPIRDPVCTPSIYMHIGDRTNACADDRTFSRS